MLALLVGDATYSICTLPNCLFDNVPHMPVCGALDKFGIQKDLDIAQAIIKLCLDAGVQRQLFFPTTTIIIPGLPGQRMLR